MHFFSTKERTQVQLDIGKKIRKMILSERKIIKKLPKKY